MGQIHVLQRRVEVAQQGLALFEEEARGTGARLSDAFGRIEDVLREKDFQLVRREMEVQRLTRENAQAKMLLETLLETLEKRRPPALREIIEEFERKLAASAALHDAGGPSAGVDGDGAGSEPADGAIAAADARPAEPPPPEAEAAPEPEAAQAAAAIALPQIPPAPAEAPAQASAFEPIAAFADPAGDVTVAVPVAAAREPEELAATAVARAEPDPNDELIAGARAQLRTRGGAAGARLLDEEQRRYAYKVWLGPIMIGVGCLGPLALVLARIAH